MEYTKLKTVETEQAFVKEEDMRFSESDSENDDNDEGTESNEELIVTFTPYVSGGLSGRSIAAAVNDINYSVRIKVIGRILCLHLDEQLVPVEKYDDDEEEEDEEEEEEETDEKLEFEEDFGAGKEDVMTETHKTTVVEGDFPLWSPTQSSTSPLRVLVARPDSAKLLPKGALHSPPQLTSKRSNVFFHQYTVHSSHDSFREVAVRKTKRKTVSPQRLPTKRDMPPASERNSVAGPSRSDLGERLEKAIYHLPKDKLMNILSYFILALVLICCGLVYVYAGYESGKLNTVQKTNTMVSSIQQQQGTLLNTITTIQLVMLVNLGIITDTRYASIGVASVRYYMYYKLSYYLAEYIEVSREINDNLNYIDQGLLPELYGDQFDVIYALSPASTRKTNNFGLCSDLTSSFTNLGKASLSEFAYSNKDVLFIFNNSMNTPLVTARRSIQIILSDAKDTLYNVNSVNLTLASLAGGMGALLLVLLFIDFKKFLRRRAYLIEILVRLDQKKILSHLALTKSFAERLKNKEYEIQDEKELRLTTLGFVTQDIDNQNGFKASAKNQKNISYKALNNQTIKGLILTSAFIITFISVFVVFSSLYKANLHKILDKMDLMFEINQIGVDMSLVTTGINEYIMNNNSTELASEPIGEKIDKILKAAGSYPLFLTSITDSDEYQNEVIAEILQDSLCNVDGLVPSPYSAVCKTLANGILDRGLIQMINYLVQGYESTKDTFDSYGHTILAAKLALNTKEKVTGELIAGFMVNAYHKIEQILQVQCDELIDNHKKSIKNISVAYTLIYMILGTLLSTKVWKFIKYERLNWRKALRHVPYGIISTNKLLKTYLINNCDNMLDSVKSSLL